MRGRLVAGLGACVVLAAVNAVLLATEQVAEPRAETAVEMRATDPLADLTYTPGSRDPNLRRMGFDDKQVADAMRRFEERGTRYKLGRPGEDVVHATLEATEDQPGLRAAFCGRGTQLPARYAALAWLVEDRDGVREPVDLSFVRALERQEWADAVNLNQLYAALEDRTDRRDDATRMGLAAVLASREKDAAARNAPWGDSILRPWSWKEVRQKTGVEDRLLRYVVHLHLVLEDATAIGTGLCST